MQRILTAAEMREVDRLTIQSGIPGLILMETAAARVVDALIERFAPLSGERVLILCGKGNNGGDGLAVARQLLLRGVSPDTTVLLLADPADLKGDAAENLRMLRAAGGEVQAVSDSDAWRDRAVRDRAMRATLIVDALLGTGLSGPARGFYAEVIEDLRDNFSHARFVAVDMPSGMASDLAESSGPCAPADVTVTFTAPKVAQVLAPNCERVGALRIASIGTRAEIVESLPGEALRLIEAADAAPLVGRRLPAAHKGDFGHAVIVAGSRDRPGAAVMAGQASARGGAGLTTVVTARSAAGLVVGATPEVMTVPLDEAADGSIVVDAFDPEWFGRATVVAVGPGLGVAAHNQALVRSIAQQVDQPLVVDADGLTALAGLEAKDWPRRSSPLVLTPHPGEMARLTGLDSARIQADRLGTARRFAVERAVYVVLKGQRTLVACPDGTVWVNPTGTPALATGGSGDVLLGMIAALLAQFPERPVHEAVIAAVYLHGLAAEIAAAGRGEQNFLPTDLLGGLPRATERVRSGA